MLGVAIAAATEGTEHKLPVPPSMFGIGALVLFAVLLGVTWMFRATSTKH